MAEDKRDWKTSLNGSTTDTDSGRTGVLFPSTYRLTGIDGTLNGALRPFPGFKEIHRIEPGSLGSNHDASSRLLDFFPVSFIVGDDGYAYGFVYRVQRKDASLQADVFIDYWSSKTRAWTKGTLLMSEVPLTVSKSPIDGRHMAVTQWGRFVYVFVQDRSPIAFGLKRGTPYPEELTLNPGPGLKPYLVSNRNSSALTSIVSTGDAQRPAKAQIRLMEGEPNLVTGLFTGSVYPKAADTRTKLKPGDYAFAYFLYNSGNGRRSALSEIATATTTDFIPPGFVSEAAAVPLYAVLDICYDKTKYDQAYVFRSVRVQSAGGTFVANILQLDSIITLADYKTKKEDDGVLAAGVGQSAYWYELEDKALAVQDTYVDRTLFDVGMPKGGAAFFYRNTMLVGGIRTSSLSSTEENRAGDGTTGVGETRWSSLADVSPELFPPGNRYYPKVPNNSILAFNDLGQSVVGFSNDRQYVFRKEGNRLGVYEMHEGFGITGPFASASVGTMAYFVTPKGIKTVDSSGALDELKSADEIIVRDWAGTTGDVSMAYDARTSALFVLNPSRAEAVVLWFNSAKVCTIKDTQFVQVARGIWPASFTFDASAFSEGEYAADYGNPLEERAMWAFTPAQNFDGDVVEGASFRIFVVDSDRENTESSGSNTGRGRLTMVPVNTDGILEVAEDFNPWTPFLSLVAPSESGIPFNLWGVSVYIVSSQDPRLLYRKAVIRNVDDWYDGTVQLTDSTFSQFVGLKAGDKVAISPIYFEIQTGCLPSREEEFGGAPGAPDPFTVKHVSSIGCSFSDVGGASSVGFPDICRFQSLVFRGNEQEPSAYGNTVDKETGALAVSVENREGVRYAAITLQDETSEGKHGVSGTSVGVGVRIVASDLDFRMQGIRVVGAVRDSSISRR